MDHIVNPTQTNASNFSQMDYIEQSDPEVANDLTGKMERMSSFSSSKLLNAYVNTD